jgi:hypothetical protein
VGLPGLLRERPEKHVSGVQKLRNRRKTYQHGEVTWWASGRGQHRDQRVNTGTRTSIVEEERYKLEIKACETSREIRLKERHRR